MANRIPRGSKWGNEEKYAVADDHHDNGNFTEAIQALGNDEDPPALVRKGRWMEEMASFDNTLKSDQKLKIYKEALNIVLRAVEKDNTYATAHTVIAIIKGRMTDVSGISEKVNLSKEIKTSAERALELDPEDGAAWSVLGKWNAGVADLNWAAQAAVKLLYGGMPKASHEEAINCFLRAEQCWSNAQNLCSLGQEYLKVGKKQEAKDALLKAVSSNGSKPIFRLAIAEAQAILNKEFR